LLSIAGKDGINPVLLSEFKKVLAGNGNATVRFILPTGTKIPPHAHVTEVARIDKRFIDCGGTRHTETTCRLQTWFQDDTDHRLTAGKLLAVLAKASAILETDDLEVEVEHEAPFIAQFPVAALDTDGTTISIKLGIKHTACLAEDRCCPPNLNKAPVYARLPDFTNNKCC
jgi:hypothetical protein